MDVRDVPLPVASQPTPQPGESQSTGHDAALLRERFDLAFDRSLLVVGKAALGETFPEERQPLLDPVLTVDDPGWHRTSIGAVELGESGATYSARARPIKLD